MERYGPESTIYFVVLVFNLPTSFHLFISVVSSLSVFLTIPETLLPSNEEHASSHHAYSVIHTRYTCSNI